MPHHTFQKIECMYRVLWVVDITVGDDFLGLCDQKSFKKLVSSCEWLQNSDHLKHGIEGKYYWRDIEKIINALSEIFNV